MYVERLFEGKVLTDENIELKEEIYGNLVARYEDYVAGGMSESEALEKTKASMTSIDDVLGGSAGASADTETLPAASAVSVSTDGTAATTFTASSTAAAASNSTKSKAASASGSGTESGFEPESKSTELAPTTKASSAKSFLAKYKRLLIVGGAAVLVILFGLGAVLAIDELVDDDDDERSPYVNSAGRTSQMNSNTGNNSDSTTTGESSTSDTTGDSSTSSTSSTLVDGVSTTRSGYDIYLDANGNLRYDDDLADDLLYAVVESTYADVSGYVDTALSDTSSVQAFVSSLPMGEWVSTVDSTQSSGGLSYTYESVPAMYDGDSIEAALAYNATVIFCAMAEVETIEVLVSESDEPYDYDYYVFERSSAETLYGVSLTSDLVSEDGWTQLKSNNLYTTNFIERLIEWAERS